MNLLYRTNFRKSTVLGSLFVASAALALIVILLWFGSIRSPDPASASKASTVQGDGAGARMGIQFLGHSPEVGEEQEFQRCVLPGIPCTLGPDDPIAVQTASVQANEELRTY